MGRTLHRVIALLNGDSRCGGAWWVFKCAATATAANALHVWWARIRAFYALYRDECGHSMIWR